MGDKVFIKYTALPGIVSEYTVSPKDFEAAGVDYGETLVFNKANRYTVDASGLPDEVVAVFAEHPDFSVGKSDKAPRLMDSDDYPTQEEAAKPDKPTAPPDPSLSDSSVAGATGTTTTV